MVKETPCDAVFTPEDLSEEQLMIRDAVTEFADKELWPNKARFEKKDYAFTESLMQKSGELGLLGIGISEAYGGLGMGFVSTLMVCDYISGTSGSFSTAFGAHTCIGTMPIVLYGTEAQKKKYVPRLATGEWFGAYCLTEPGAGSDANSGKTKAVLSEDGTYYSISGQKMWISNAGFCNLFIVFARIENDSDITSFIVENDPANGITLGEEEHKLGIHSSSTRQVFFNETRVTVENMLAGRGEGFKIAINVLNIGRIKLAAACLDVKRRSITEAVNYANQRIQFKVPISEFGAIKAKLAEMATACYANESAAYRAAKCIEDRIALREAKGNTAQEAELKSFEEYAIECSILKVAASEALQFVTDEGIQIFGGMGFSAETPMESAWRDARITRIYEGTNEINRMLAIGLLIKKAVKGHADIFGAAKNVADELAAPSVEVPDYSQPFSAEKEMIKKLKNVFLMLSAALIQKYANRLKKRQQLLMALADILIEIYITESTLLRTEKNVKRFGEDTQSVQTAMTRVKLYQATDHIARKGKEIISSFEKGEQQHSMLATVKRFTSYRSLPDITALRNTIAERLKSENRYCF